MHKRFGTALHRLRLAAGMTQADLAHATGYHEGHISHVEHGRRRPNRDLAVLGDAVLASGTELSDLYEQIYVARTISSTLPPEETDATATPTPSEAHDILIGLTGALIRLAAAIESLTARPIGRSVDDVSQDQPEGAGRQVDTVVISEPRQNSRAESPTTT